MLMRKAQSGSEVTPKVRHFWGAYHMRVDYYCKSELSKISTYLIVDLFYKHFYVKILFCNRKLPKKSM